MRSRLFIPVILLLSTVAFTATDIYLPSLPAIQRSLHTTTSWVKFSITIYLLGWGLSQIAWGSLSDYFGRRPLVLLGLTVGICGTLTALFADTLWMLLLGRWIQGLGLGAITLFRPILRDVYEGTELARIGGGITVSASFMMAAAPTIGGYIERSFGWRFNFVVLALWLLLTLVLFYLCVCETNKRKDPLAIKLKYLTTKYLHLFKQPIFLGYACCSSLVFGGFMAYLAVSPFLIQRGVGLDPVGYGWTALLVATSLGVGAGLSRLLVKQLGMRRLLEGCLALLLVGSVALLLLGFVNLSLGTLVPVVYLYGIGAGALWPLATALSLTPFPESAGIAGALYGALQILGGFAGSGAISLLPERTQIPLGALLIILSLLAWLSARWASTKATPAAR